MHTYIFLQRHLKSDNVISSTIEHQNKEYWQQCDLTWILIKSLYYCVHNRIYKNLVGEIDNIFFLPGWVGCKYFGLGMGLESCSLILFTIFSLKNYHKIVKVEKTGYLNKNKYISSYRIKGMKYYGHWIGIIKVSAKNSIIVWISSSLFIAENFLAS